MSERILKSGTRCCPVKKCKGVRLEFEQIQGMRLIQNGFLSARCPNPKHGMYYRVKPD